MIYTRVKVDLIDPSVKGILGFGRCSLDDIEGKVNAAALVNEEIILNVEYDGNNFFLLNNVLTPKERHIDQVIELSLGENLSISFPEGTRISVRNNIKNIYIANEIVEDGKFEFRSDIIGDYTINVVLPPGHYRYFQYQSCEIRIR